MSISLTNTDYHHQLVCEGEVGGRRGREEAERWEGGEEKEVGGGGEEKGGSSLINDVLIEPITLSISQPSGTFTSRHKQT